MKSYLGRLRAEKIIWPLALGLVLISLYLSGVTIFSAWTARSEVPWRDQWTFLDDSKQILAHNWGRLWYCYWGGRYVMTRVVTLLSVVLFSKLNSPIIILTLAIQAAHVALLVFTAWRLFGRLSKLVFVIACALLVQFGFSSLQLENFIWPGQVGYILGWACATAAFFLLARTSEAGRTRGVILLSATVFVGTVSTLSMPAGVLVWPVLALQSWMLRLTIRMRALVIVAGVFVSIIYFRGYEKGPSMGMGVLSAIRHLDQSIPIVGMMVAAPLTSVSNTLAEVIGSTALLVAIYALAATFRVRPGPVVTVPAALAFFGLLCFLSIVTSRISPEFIMERESLHLLVVPSRYYTFVFLFWSGLLIVSIWLTATHRRQWPQLAVLGSLALVVTVGMSFWETGEAANWRGYYRELDVAGSALIMHVEDPSNRYLTQIYPDPGLRSQMSAWLESRSEALFSERRAHLVGLRVAREDVADGRCRGEIQSIQPLAAGVVRLAGWVEDIEAGGPPRDLVFADQSGLIAGIARSGLRRPDMAGKVGDAPVEAIGWQGYVRVQSGGAITAYGVLDEGKVHYCRIGISPALP
jgi:hypothetical protein